MARRSDARDDGMVWSGYSIVTAGDYSVFCWARADHAAGVLAGQYEDYISFNNEANSAYHAFCWSHEAAGYAGAATHQGSNSGWYAASFGTLSANTWYALCATYDVATQTLRAYRGGALQTTTTGVVDSGSTGGPARLLEHPDAGIGPQGVQIAEAARWNRVLTTDEITALARGIAPIALRRGLQFYVPCVREVRDLIGGANPTITGTSVTAHPRVIYPRTTVFGAMSQSGFIAITNLGAALQKSLAATATLEAALQKSFMATVNLGAVLQKSSAAIVNLEAVLQKGFVTTTNLEAALQKSSIATTADLVGVLQKSFMATTNLEAVLQKEFLINTQLSAYMVTKANWSLWGSQSPAADGWAIETELPQWLQ